MKSSKASPLFLTVLPPERTELWVPRRGQRCAEQVLEAGARLEVRVALDVEEEISRVWLGKQAEPTLLLGRQQLVRMRSRERAVVLQPRLMPQTRAYAGADPHRQWIPGVLRRPRT